MNSSTSTTNTTSTAATNKKSKKATKKDKVNTNAVVKKEIKQEKLTDSMPTKKKRDRFNGMSEEEVLKRTLPDHLCPNLDIIIVRTFLIYFFLRVVLGNKSVVHFNIWCDKIPCIYIYTCAHNFDIFVLVHE